PPSPPRIVAEYGDDVPQRDYAEEAYCARYLTTIESSRTYLFAIDRPLPGYKYRIVWSLPEEDPTEPPVKPGVVGTLLEIRKQLGPDGGRRADVVEALHELRDELGADEVLRGFG